MPLYEFECTQCGIRFERILRFTDPLPEACPECGGRPQKLLSAPSFQFKGSGWYITDYARKSAAPASETKSETSEAPKAESKPSEKKAETSPTATKSSD